MRASPATPVGTVRSCGQGECCSSSARTILTTSKAKRDHYIFVMQIISVNLAIKQFSNVQTKISDHEITGSGNYIFLQYLGTALGIENLNRCGWDGQQEYLQADKICGLSTQTT